MRKQSLRKGTPLHQAVLAGTIALLVGLSGSGWFAFHQYRQLRSLEEAQVSYLGFVGCRSSLAQLDSRLADSPASPEMQREIHFQMGLLRFRHALLAGHDAIRRGSILEKWLQGRRFTSGTISHEAISVLIVELDEVIGKCDTQIRNSAKTVAAGIHFYMVFILFVLFGIVSSTGRILSSTYRQSLRPLTLLADRLSHLNKDIPESIRDARQTIHPLFTDPGNSPEIRFVSETVTVLCRDIEEKGKKLDELYIRDEKTNLYNYRHFKEHLIIDVERAKRFGDRVSLAMIDIDHFKQYNDTHGHIAGDRVLSKIAEIIREQCRSTDIPSRFGGEEFAVLFPKTDSVMTGEIAERFRKVISAEPFAHEKRQPGGHLTVSIGIATYPEDAPDWYTLINNADHALYHAKSAGRNQVVSYASLVIGKKST
jgi:diguanylate cyclase (GGDEF)-like protein